MWEEPPLGSLKFNIDAACKGCMGEAGIRGVLKDDKGSMLLIFSKVVGVMDSNAAELMALWEGFQIIVASDWARSHNIIFESNSHNAIIWVLNPHQVSWRMRSTIMKTEGLKLKIVSWSVRQVPWSAYGKRGG